MKLRSYAAIILGSAVLVSQLPAIAQMAPKMDTPEVKAPAAEMPAGASDLTPTPIAPAATPETTPMPSLSKPESEQPAGATTPLPTLETAPTEPRQAPAAAAPRGPVPAAMTEVLPQETITGIKTVSLPEPMPIRPAYFTLPIVLKVAQDTSATSTTPISDRYTGKANWNLTAWLSGVRNCLQQQPKMLRVVGDQSVPFMLNGAEGTIMVNADNRAICPM
jgi:hypothetical protein